MLTFPKWKIFIIFNVVLVFLLCALPNFLSGKVRESLPTILPEQKLSLGLDLQGGSYLLLELDFDSYIEEWFAGIKNEIRKVLRINRFGYRKLSSNEKGISFYLRDEGKISSAKEIIRDIDPDFLIENDGSFFRISYDDQTWRTKKSQLIEQTIEIINRRVNESGTKEPVIQRNGENRIILQLPGIDDPDALKVVLGKTAKLNFHLVNEDIDPELKYSGELPNGSNLFAYDKNEQVFEILYSEALISGESLEDAKPTFQEGMPVVAIRFDSLGAKKFAEITRKNVGKRFAIVLDEKIITSPVINEPILDGSAVISGKFTVESSNELALLLRAGALPVDMQIIEERSVGPSLGSDSVEAGKKAAGIAFIAVLVFMIIAYRSFGLIANSALIVNMLILIGALSMFGATLTLPGIAGIVLTMGMAVDANVLIFERIKEEARKGKSLLSSIESGFSSAFSTILDSNITTLIAAFVLFYFGSGNIKGFAVTLSLGILSSMFTAIMLTRYMIYVWFNFKKRSKLPI